MTFEDLIKHIETASVNTGKTIDEILITLNDFITQNYSTETTASKRKVIEEVKKKILVGLYRMDNHSLVSKRPNIKDIFDLDNYETTLANEASEELEKAGLIEGGEYFTKLTDKGVLVARES